jgi:hypothetical protein
MGIFNWFKNRKKDKALASFVYNLGPLLAKQYGKSKFYSPDQIKKMFEEYKFDEEFLSYAMAMNLDKSRFGDVKKKMNVDWDYESLRKEVADKFLGGNSKFTGLNMNKTSRVRANTSDPGLYSGLDGVEHSDHGGGDP